MRYGYYSFLLVLAFISVIGAESFIQKKMPAKKPRIKQEDLVARHDAVLNSAADLVEAVAHIQKSCLTDVRIIVEQQKNNFFATASQETLRKYDNELQLLQESMKTCRETMEKIKRKIVSRLF